MKTIVTIGLLCGIGCVAAPAGALADGGPDGARQGVLVEVLGGRVFTGEVDPRSDENSLWLCSNRGPSAIFRPLEWNCIAAVELAGLRFTTEEFRAAMRSAGKTLGTASRPHSGHRTIRLVGAPDTSGTGIASVEAAGRRIFDTPRLPSPAVGIRWLEIEVRTGNWDGDVEPDGVLVQIRPHDADGVLTAVDGSLTVELVGKEKHPVNRARDYVDLGRWTHEVRVEEFGPSGATYRVPFSARNPVFDMGLVSRG